MRRRMRRIGRRTVFLVMFGLIYTSIGYLYITTPLSVDAARAYHFALSIAPLPFWGAVWALAGIAALVTAPIPNQQKWGFAALSGISVVWATTSFLSYVEGYSPRGPVGSLVYLALGGAIHVVSGLVEAPSKDNPPE